MSSNDFLPFAGGAGANVIDQATYAALTTLLANGFSSGTAQSAQLNKVWRQSSIMAAVLAQMIVDNTGQNAVDDGTTATLLANLKKATNGRLLRTSVYTLVSGVQYVSINGGSATATGATTFTPLSLTSSIDVEVVGGGGGGGGCAGSSTTSSYSGGGGGGSYGRSIFTAAQFGSSQAVTIGAGGAGGTPGNAGVNGSTSSFGALLSAPGGIASGSSPGNTGAAFSGGTAISSAPSGANVLASRGAPGTYGLQLATSSGVGGNGGGTNFGGGISGTSEAPRNGNAGINPGSGGSGATSNAGNTAGSTGGAGASGMIIVREYA